MLAKSRFEFGFNSDLLDIAVSIVHHHGLAITITTQDGQQTYGKLYLHALEKCIGYYKYFGTFVRDEALMAQRIDLPVIGIFDFNAPLLGTGTIESGIWELK